MRTLSGLLMVVALASAGEQLRREAPPQIPYSFGNEYVRLVFQPAAGRYPLARVINGLSKRTLAVASDDFAVGIEGRPALRAADCTFQQARKEAIPGGERFIIQLTCPARGNRLDIVYEQAANSAFIRRRLEVTSAKPVELRQVDVWLVGIEGKASHLGFGEPVFLDDTFWGLEYPGGHNSFPNGTVKLTHYPGSTTGRFVSKTAVLGVAEQGRVAQRFQDYIATIQATPKEQRLFVNYNTWWTLMPPTEKNCVELIRLFKEKLFDPHGESFDTFTIDDGWDRKETLWELVPERFPNGFAPLVKPLKAMKANLGLWLSPSSGYSHAPHLAKQGYEHNSNAWYCCQSGPKYRRDIVQRVTALAKQYDLAFYKFDGFCPSCEATGHGHLPGHFAREANIDAYIELMTAVKQAKPGIFLDPTCGMWLSPWWLPYCDSIWGSVSGDYPDVIVPAPIIRDSATATRDAVFRQRCREHPGYPPNAIEHLGIIVITPEKWEDNAIAVVGRGCRLLTLYINPKFFTKGDADWAFLASVLKWTRHNAETLGHTVLIGGDPLKREWYGYAHFAGNRGVLSLRNPFIEPQKVSLKLDESIGWPREGAAGSFVAAVVYPRREVLKTGLLHGSALDLTLQGYETMLVQVAQASPFGAVSETKQTGGRPSCSVEGAGLTLQTADASSQLRGKCLANVPEGVNATMHLLADPRGAASAAVECAAQVNGKPATVRPVRSGANQAHSRHPWTWFEFDLPAGRSDVAITIKPSKQGGFTRCEAGWWLWAEHPLQTKTLPQPPALKEPLPLPIGMETEREIITIQSPKLFAAPRVWPKADAPSVWLDELPPDDATLGWGKLQTNQSVWEKPMTVAGRKFARGLGTHAESRIVYDLSGGKFKSFRCLVGRDEHAQDGAIVFQVKLDGRKLFDSGPMTKATAAKAVEVAVSGGTTLELLTLDGGDGIGGDHGDWAEAQLLRR
ncbi:MAG TPA: NPCBM/NEW2 domain-containing protein [Planctomycetota bacterium]|nr:NPCBM/NEW2 domain-containing protein [Planctomycetota bacterium]